MLSLAALAFVGLLLIATSAFASKEVVDYIGSDSQAGEKGGEFFNPHDVAVNTTGAGPANAGDIYVADGASNHRIQRFDADGSFIGAWGANVLTAPTLGSSQYEICTVAENCRRGEPRGAANAADNANNGSLNRPSSVAVDGDTGNVYVSDRLNNRVNEYTGDGTFIRSFGWGVDATTAGDGYEVCPASDRCTSGLPGSGAGQIGETDFYNSGVGIAISPPDGNAATGTLFLADTTNRRVNTYALDGTSPSSFGSETQFASGWPRKVAVDSRGIVYASNSTNNGEIERYDSEDANGGGVGFLAPIASPPLLGSAAAGLAVDPDSDGAGPEEDVLYVLSGTFTAVVQQFGPVNDPGLTAAPTAVDETHGAAAEFHGVEGLGLDDSSGRLFVSATNAGGETASRVYILDNALAPTASIDPVTTFDAHSATFSGSVDPNGARIGYHFEYVDDAEFQANGFANAQRYPLTELRIGAGENPVAVEQEIPHHLVASTTYHVRLVAKQTFTSTQVVSSPVTFTTLSSAPTVVGTTASAGTDTATLRATVESENQATSYHFEWGLDTEYGNSTPVGNLPAAGNRVAVSADLSGLTTGTAYHYRLVATNGTGTTQGPDQAFSPAAPPQLPQRGYEIASQYPTGGVPIVEVTGRTISSEDGDHIEVAPLNPFPHSKLTLFPDQAVAPLYVFNRGSDGWQDRTEVGFGSFPVQMGWSANLERIATTTKAQGPGSDYQYEDFRADPDDQNHGFDVYERQPDGSISWISRDPRIPAGTPQTTPGEAIVANQLGQFSMSADGRTVVFRSTRQLLDTDTTPGFAFRLYKWEDGQLSFIGARPDGSMPGHGSYLGDDPFYFGGYARYAVSRDGSRVIFHAQVDKVVDGNTYGASPLYVQTDGEPTVEATKAQGVPPLVGDQPYNVKYRGASADASRVFFTSSSRLTPDSGASASSYEGVSDLYAYDVETDTLRDLTPRLDGFENPSVDPAAADRADVRSVLANSSDGKRVYFVASAQYPTAPNPEGELPSAGGHNLYMAELDGIDEAVELRFIGDIGSEYDELWGRGWSGRTALASNDGSVLGFRSTESLTGQPLGGTGQLFVYNVDRGTLTCPSCPADGSLPVNSVNEYSFGGLDNRADWQGDMGIRRWVSNDGSVFFTTSTALLPADQNAVTDVYEFHDGALGLISTGTATTDSLLANASADGSTVFINTQAALVPQDKEPGVNKIYAARVGGGFPYVAPPPPCDFNAGACEGTPSTAPQSPGAGTAAFEGPGDPKPSSKRACPKGKRKVRAKGKTRCVKRQHKRTAKNDRRASR